MARSIWTGSISFGLVSIPVGLFSAVEEKTIRFHQLQRGTSDRIRYKKVNERTGEEVQSDEIVKGYEISTDRYVVLEAAELEAASPTASRGIEIEDFVDQSEIDPIYYDRTYYLAPKDDTAARPYGLLLEAMKASDKVGIASFVMRGKEHLGAVRAARDGRVLVLETMYFGDEIRDAGDAVGSTRPVEAPKQRELAAALSLIESMDAAFEPERYHDTYRAEVQKLIDAKLAGEEIVVGTAPAADSNVVDLMEALRRSAERIRKERGSGAGGGEEQGADESPAGAAAPAEAKAPASRRNGKRAATKKSSEQLSMLSKDELYQLAQSLEVPGRSKMSRGQLEVAISRANEPAPAAEAKDAVAGEGSRAPTRRSQRRAS